MTGLLNRRAFTTGLLASGLAPAALATSAPPLPPIHFAIRMAGSQVGHHKLDFAMDGDDLVVSVDIRAQVKLLFINAFDYKQIATERWRDGRLIAFDSVTRDGDKHDEVTARAIDDAQISVRSKRFGDRVVDGDIWPGTAFWRPAVVRRSQFLDAARGDIREATITARERGTIETPTGPRIAQKFDVDASRDFSVWYGIDGDWLGLEWSGFGLNATYRRI